MLASQTEEPISSSETFAEELEPNDLEVAVDEPDRIVPAIEFRDVHLSFEEKKF